MISKNPHAIKILVIEPSGFTGHININTFFVRLLGEIGKVTLVSPAGYLTSCSVDLRIDIPEALGRHHTKVGARLSQMRVLNYILNNVPVENYDAIIFLAYETISFSLLWPKKIKTFLYEHNNIENLIGSQIKTFFYKYVSNNCTHLTFQSHIAQYIRVAYKRRATCIPHPYYRSDVSDSGNCQETAPNSRRSMPRKVIFSPSGSTPVRIQEELKRFATMTKGAYYAICKGGSAEKSDDWEVCRFFDKYEDLMCSCDLVFLGARFGYRPSGVAYEALSYGKPIVLLDCLFARELHNEYPYLVFIIKEINDILKLDINEGKIKEEYKRFLHKHSYEAIRSKIETVFRMQNIKK